MMHVWLAVAAAVTALAAQPPVQSSRAREAREHSVYVSALDAKGAPVAGLTPADIVVREDGAAREVLKVAPATTPMQVMLLVDDSAAVEPMVSELRDALRAFVKTVAGKAQVGLVTFGERPTSVTQLTTAPEVLEQGISRIFARPGTGAYLTDAVFEVAQGMEKRHDERPVIVVVTAEGVQYGNVTHDRVLEQLAASGAVLHVVAVGTPASTMDDETRQRNLLLAEGTERTGGRRDQLVSHLGLTERMRQLGAELVNQLVVTYARPESLIPPERIQVTSARAGVTVRARTRVASR